MSESICVSCDHKRICDMKIINIGSTVMTGCSRYEKCKPFTNADRIRAMTDEELAYLLGDTGTITPQWCMEHDPCPSLNDDPVPCWKCALDWLRQEVEE